MKDPTIYLEHVLESIKLIEQYIVGLDLEKFLENVEKQDGDKESAITWLSRALSAREPLSIAMDTNMMPFESIRDDPRYKAMLDEVMNLVDQAAQ